MLFQERSPLAIGNGPPTPPKPNDFSSMEIAPSSPVVGTATKSSPPPPTPPTHGYGLLVVLTCMMVAIPFYWGSLEGGKGVDSLHGLMAKLIAYFFLTLILTVSSMLYLISLVSRITYTKAWTSSAFGER